MSDMTTLPDLAPGVPSRILSITSVQLGEHVPTDGMLTFRVVDERGDICDLRHAGSDTLVTCHPLSVQLVDGKAAVRLPVDDPGTVTDRGGVWAIQISRSWNPCRTTMVRIAAGSGAISLADLADITPMRGWRPPTSLQPISGVQVTMTEGSLSGSGSLSPTGILQLALSIPSSAYYRGLLAGRDLTTMTSPTDAGLWALSAQNAYGGAAFTGSGMLLVDNAGVGAIQQTMWQAGVDAAWTRRARNAYASPPLWHPWRRVGTVEPITLAAGADMDTMRTTVDAIIENTSTAQQVTGWPTDATPLPAHLQVRATSTGITWQQLHTYGPQGAVWTRQTDNVGVTPFPWTPWVKQGTGAAAANGASSNTPMLAVTDRSRMLIEDFERRHPVTVISTGAVAFRFDHGLANFDTKIRPLLEARQLPYSLVLNSSSWGLAENAGVTAAMVDSWVAAGRAEIWNHGQWHWDVSIEQLPAMIVDGLTQLQQQLPSASIDGFALAGVGGTGYQGLLPVLAAAKLADTVAGRLMLQHHAVVTGAIPGTEQRILDGRVRQGLSHTTLDTMSLDAAKAVIATAQQQKTGAQFMLHPSLVDTTGNMATAAFEALLDHVAAERDAGRLHVASPYSLMTTRAI